MSGFPRRAPSVRPSSASPGRPEERRTESVTSNSGNVAFALPSSQRYRDTRKTCFAHATDSCPGGMAAGLPMRHNAARGLARRGSVPTSTERLYSPCLFPSRRVSPPPAPLRPPFRYPYSGSQSTSRLMPESLCYHPLPPCLHTYHPLFQPPPHPHAVGLRQLAMFVRPPF